MSIRKGRLTSQGLLATPVNFPIATIHAFAGTTAPEGWAMCDGSEVSKTQYAALYAVIGDIYGTPVDSNNFVLPDLRGEFLRGLDDMGTAAGARGVDSGRALGSVQNQATAKNGLSASTSGTANSNGDHKHETSITQSNGDIFGDGNFYSNGGALPSLSNNNAHLTNTAGAHIHTLSATTTLTGDAETRPRNCAINYIIKL